MLTWIARLLRLSPVANKTAPTKMCGGQMGRHCHLGNGKVLLCCKKCGATRKVDSYAFVCGLHDGDLCMAQEVLEPSPMEIRPVFADGRTRRLSIDRR